MLFCCMEGLRRPTLSSRNLSRHSASLEKYERLLTLREAELFTV
jgi:hypothetical protein